MKVMTITDDDIQAWLEETADRWLQQPDLALSFPIGVTEFGVRHMLDPRSLSHASAYERFEITGLEFYAVWCGLTIAIKRMPLPHMAP